MKKLTLLLMTVFSTYWTYGQILYDNGPIIISNPNAFEIQGNRWQSNCISFFFQNGTNDIAGDLEQEAIIQAFRLWSDATPLVFFEVNTPDNADIVISWGTDNHGDDFPFDFVNGVLAHAFFPPPNGGVIAGDIHFDDDENWTLNNSNSSNQPIDLVTVAAHEIGHSLGLNHSSVSGALMFASYSGSHRFLHADDIEGIQVIYGSNTLELSDIESVCSSMSYIITLTLPCDESTPVTWSSSNNVQIVSSNNTSATIRARNSHSSGNGWIRATLSNGIEFTEEFEVGVPFGMTVSGAGLDTRAWTYYFASFNTPPIGVITRYEWRIPNVAIRGSRTSQVINISPYNSSSGSEINVQVRSWNACGCSPWANTRERVHGPNRANSRSGRRKFE